LVYWKWQDSERKKKVLDKKTLQRLQDIEKLPESDKQNIFYTHDNLVKAAKINVI